LDAPSSHSNILIWSRIRRNLKSRTYKLNIVQEEAQSRFLRSTQSDGGPSLWDSKKKLRHVG
jgi:hypothetical protein